MKKQKLTREQKEWKLNEQRIGFILILCNILEAKKGVNQQIKSAVAASLINIIEFSMIDGDDDELKELINGSIKHFCTEIETKNNIKDYHLRLKKSVLKTRELIKDIEEKISRIKDGEDILKNICLN